MSQNIRINKCTNTVEKKNTITPYERQFINDIVTSFNDIEIDPFDLAFDCSLSED